MVRHYLYFTRQEFEALSDDDQRTYIDGLELWLEARSGKGGTDAKPAGPASFPGVTRTVVQ